MFNAQGEIWLAIHHFEKVKVLCSTGQLVVHMYVHLAVGVNFGLGLPLIDHCIIWVFTFTIVSIYI